MALAPNKTGFASMPVRLTSKPSNGKSKFHISPHGPGGKSRAGVGSFPNHLTTKLPSSKALYRYSK